MDTTKKALQEIAYQLKAIHLTVAALEAYLDPNGFKGHRVTDLKILAEQSEGFQNAAARLQVLIDALPESSQT